MTSTDARPATATPTPVRTRAYREGRLVAEGFPLAEASDHLATDGCVLWIDLVDPRAEDVEALGDELGFHELAVEDALQDGQRSKLDRYPDHLFVALYDAGFDAASGEVRTSEVKALVTHRALVTIHHPDVDAAVLTARWDGSAELAGHGVSWLLWGLLDLVADRQQDCADALDDALEALADDLFDPAPRGLDVQKRSFALRQGLVRLRRVSGPMRELVGSLLRQDLAAVQGELRPWFEDVEDHVLRVAGQTDALRDLVQTILDTDLNLRSVRMNEVMKKVTSWAAIIAVPTAVTGFYGQNVPYPGAGETSGFVVSSVLVVGGAAALWLAFRRRDWL